ncbi:MAG: acyl-CoA dehydrogenase family protein, partial [Alphaproteobacteria bacterium]|nr:acyl-CoA dehydrogenase family protein [Alphaproteobacteria bacterium]
LGELGIMGLGIPEDEGGAGGSAVEQVLALEILGRKATSLAVFTVVQYMATKLLRHYGSAAQKAERLAPLCRGEIKPAFALTEAAGGTDVLASITTKGERVGDGWRLNGTKMWISGAALADVITVIARTGEHRSRGMTMFAVPRGTKGLGVRELDTFAIFGLDTCEVVFDEVSLPAEAVLGEVDQGFMQVLSTLNSERLNAAAVATGIGNGALRAATEYARERQAFGRPIGQFQALQHRLVNAGVDLEAAWLLTLRAADDDAAGRPFDVSSSMAKLATAKAGLAAADVGMEVMGGAGVDVALPMQRYYRDIRLYIFAPLTNDMITNYLGENWLDLPRSF